MTLKPLTGSQRVPGDKSISHRALLFSALAEGRSVISGLSMGGDALSTRSCLEAMGVSIRSVGETLEVTGAGLHGLKEAPAALDAGNSGTTMRLLSGILVGQRFPSTITGDDSLRRRPMKRIIDPLRAMGGIIGGNESGTAPLHIEPSQQLHGIDYAMPMASAQVKSAILLAGLYAEGTTSVLEAIPTRDHTERMLGLRRSRTTDGTRVSVEGGSRIAPREYRIPGDPSGAAFLVAAASLVKNSEITITDVCLNPSRIAYLGHFLSLEASVQLQRIHDVAGEPVGDIAIRSTQLQGTLRIDASTVADVIDEIPILAVTAMAAGCGVTVRDAAELRKKESDRIAALVGNFRALGVDVEEYPDGFAFEPKNGLIGSEIETHHDHRIAMSFGVAGLVIPGIQIKNPEIASISFPGFWNAIGRDKE